MHLTIPYIINTDAESLGEETGFVFFVAGLITAVIGFFLFPKTKPRPSGFSCSRNMLTVSLTGYQV